MMNDRAAIFALLQWRSRHRLYREHKFLTAYLNDFTRLVGTTDFADNAQVAVVSEALDKRRRMLAGHARHEDESIHALLRAKGSRAHEDLEKEHHSHGATFSRLAGMVETIFASANPEERVMMGHEFGLAWSRVEAQNLMHQHREETVLMPALWELCTDEELQAIDAKAYGEMSSDDMVAMMAELFPHMNADDRRFVLDDINRASPDKFPPALAGIAKAANSLTNQRILLEEELQGLLLHFGVGNEQLEQPVQPHK